MRTGLEKICDNGFVDAGKRIGYTLVMILHKEAGYNEQRIKA